MFVKATNLFLGSHHSPIVLLHGNHPLTETFSSRGGILDLSRIKLRVIGVRAPYLAYHRWIDIVLHSKSFVELEKCAYNIKEMRLLKRLLTDSAIGTYYALINNYGALINKVLLLTIKVRLLTRCAY